MEKTMENLLSILSKSTSKDDLLNMDLDKPMKDQGIDSLDAISFFFAIEKAFNIKISVDDQNKLSSLNSILKFLKSS